MRRRKAPSWLLGALAPAVLLAPPAGQPQQITGALARKIPVHLKDAPVEDALVELAQASGLNMMVDATHLEPKPGVTLDGDAPVGWAIVYLIQARPLAVTRWGESTLLFAPLPNLALLLLQARQGARVHLAGNPPDDLKLWQSMTSYLKDAGLQVETPGFEHAVPVGKLPDELQTMVIAHCQDWVVRGFEKRPGAPPGVFDQAFWDTASVWTAMETRGRETIRMFRFGVPKRQGQPALGPIIGWQF